MQIVAVFIISVLIAQVNAAAKTTMKIAITSVICNMFITVSL